MSHLGGGFASALLNNKPMNNIEKLSAALAEWGTNVAASVLPQVSIPPTSTIGRVMSGFLGLDISNYNIYKELGFLIQPTMNAAVKPMLTKYLSGFSDEKIEELAKVYAEAFLAQAREKGAVNIFGIELGANAFEGLCEIIEERMR